MGYPWGTYRNTSKAIATNDGVYIGCRRGDKGSSESEGAADNDEPLLPESISQRPEDGSAGQCQEEIAIGYPACIGRTADAHNLEPDGSIGRV